MVNARSFASVLGLLFLLFISAIDRAEAQFRPEHLTLRRDWLPNASHMPFFLAAARAVNILGSGIIVSTQTATRDPTVVKRFLAATVRAVHDIAKSPNAAIDAMVQARPSADRMLLAEQASHFAEFQYTKNSAGYPFGWFAKADWDDTRELLEEYFELPPVGAISCVQGTQDTAGGPADP